MTETPDPDIAKLFERLSNIFAEAQTGTTVTLERRMHSLGPLRSVAKDVFSAHQRLALSPHLDALTDIIEQIPLVRETQMQWAVVLSSRGFQRSQQHMPLTFTVKLSGFDITKPASKRWRKSSEMLSRARARLGQVAAATEAEAGDVERWLVQAKKRTDRLINARSAREAAWIFSALYLRDRKEVNSWESVPETILQVSAVAPPERWRELSP